MRYQENRDEILAQQRGHRASMSEEAKEAVRVRNRAWRRSPAGRAAAAAADARRRALIDAGDLIDPMIAWLIAERRCYLCGEDIAQADLELDHVIPLSRGGTHTFDNVRAAHLRCNRRKGRRLLSELSWYEAPEEIPW